MRIIVSVRICILALFLRLGMIGAQAQVLDTNNNHNWPRFAGNTVASMGVAFGGKTALKAAELTWWLSDKFLGRNSKLSVTTTGQTVDVVYNF